MPKKANGKNCRSNTYKRAHGIKKGDKTKSCPKQKQMKKDTKKFKKEGTR